MKGRKMPSTAHLIAHGKALYTSAHEDILGALSDIGRPATAAEVVTRSGRDKTTVVKHLKAAIAEGVVTRERTARSIQSTGQPAWRYALKPEPLLLQVDALPDSGEYGAFYVVDLPVPLESGSVLLQDENGAFFLATQVTVA
jgi:hypothetical protein